MEEIEITKEQAMLKGFYENLCMYFSSNYNPDMHVNYEDAKMAWNGFRSCIDHVTAKAVFPLKQYQLMKQNESAIDSIIKRELCHDLAEYSINNLASEYRISKITDSYKNIVVRVRFNFINPEKLKEVE